MKTIKILILAVITVFVFTQCGDGSIHPVLKENEYEVIDTLQTRINGFETVIGYDVIILLKSDSSYRYGYFNYNNTLTRVGVKPINLKK